MLFCFFVEAALNGINDLVVKHSAELKLYKVAIIEKLQERICDTDKVVRESLYNILQSLIFPSLKEVFYPLFSKCCWNHKKSFNCTIVFIYFFYFLHHTLCFNRCTG